MRTSRHKFISLGEGKGCAACLDPVHGAVAPRLVSLALDASEGLCIAGPWMLSASAKRPLLRLEATGLHSIFQTVLALEIPVHFRSLRQNIVQPTVPKDWDTNPLL